MSLTFNTCDSFPVESHPYVTGQSNIKCNIMEWWKLIFRASLNNKPYLILTMHFLVITTPLWETVKGYSVLLKHSGNDYQWAGAVGITPGSQCIVWVRKPGSSSITPIMRNNLKFDGSRELNCECNDIWCEVMLRKIGGGFWRRSRSSVVSMGGQATCSCQNTVSYQRTSYLKATPVHL